MKHGDRPLATLMQWDSTIHSVPAPDGTQLRASRAMKVVTSEAFILTRYGGGKPKATLWRVGDAAMPFWGWPDAKELIKYHALGYDLPQFLSGVAECEWR